MNVKHVTKDLLRELPWNLMREPTLEKFHLNALIVVKDLARDVAWMFIKDFIQERSHTAVRFVIKHLHIIRCTNNMKLAMLQGVSSIKLILMAISPELDSCKGQNGIF